jgi:ornithine carbamoyltransferase
LRHVLSDWNLSSGEVAAILDKASEIKREGDIFGDSLKNKVVILLFELSSLRTRISFESGMAQMGGEAIFYGVAEGGFTRSETLEDGVKVLSRYSDCIMARVLHHKDLERIGEAATVPVINGMTERYHPCQNLADLLTMREHKGKLKDLKIAYVGDGACNTATSTMIGCTSMDMSVTVVCPDNPKFSPSEEIRSKIEEKFDRNVKVSHDPLKGVEGSDIIYTDTWISAGMEEEKKGRLMAFPPYQVNMEMVKRTKQDSIVMHCMPAHRGYEITSEVMDSKKSVIIDQAENRMHAQKSLLLWLIKGF